MTQFQRFDHKGEFKDSATKFFFKKFCVSNSYLAFSSAFSSTLDNCKLANTNSCSSPSLASILKDKMPARKTVTLNADKIDVHEFSADPECVPNDYENSQNTPPVWDTTNRPVGAIWSRFERRRPIFRAQSKFFKRFVCLLNFKLKLY